MSELVGEAVIHVRTDSTGVNTGAEGRKAGEGYAKGFVTSLKRIAIGIGGVLAIRETINFAKESVAEGREAQKVGATTAQIIKTTGGAANVTAAQVGKLSTAISNKIGVDDEAIQSSANTVLAFKNVRNELGKGNDIFNRTIKSGQDLAALGFGSPASASKALAKALDDPAKGYTALTRLGVRLTDQQADQVKAYVKSGDTLKAQAFLLDLVESKSKGAAAAQATAGEKASVAWSNVKEAIGTALIPALDSAESAFAKKVAPAITRTISGSNDLGRGMKAAGGLIREGFHAAEPVLSKVFGVIQDGARAALPYLIREVKRAYPVVHDLAKVLAHDVQQAADNLLPVIKPLVKEAAGIASSFHTGELKVAADVLEAIGSALVSFTGFLGQHATTTQAIIVGILAMVAAYKVWVAVTKIAAGVQAALNLVLDANPIGILILALVAVAAGLIYAYKHSARFRDIIKSVGDAITGFISGTIGFVKSHWVLIVSLLGGPIVAVAIQIIKHFSSIKDHITDAVKWVATLPSRIQGAVLHKMAQVGKAVIAAFFRGLSTAGSFVGDLAGTIKDAAMGAVNSVIDLLNKAIPNKIAIPGAPDVNLPDNPIPHLARGTRSFPGGLALVGEEGPELVNLPRGAGVTPAGLTAAALGGVTVHVERMMPHDYSEFVRETTNRGRAAVMGGVTLGSRPVAYA